MLHASLEPELRAELEARSMMREFADGQIIQQRGDEPDGFWLIVEGTVVAGQFLSGGDFRAVAVLGPGDSYALAPMDHLTGAVSPGFQQHGVHSAAGLKARRPGLHGLGVGHLAANGIHPGVVTHVLALEGQCLFPTALEHPAQRRRHQRFAGTAGGAQHHQGARRVAGHSGQCRRRL